MLAPSGDDKTTILVSTSGTGEGAGVLHQLLQPLAEHGVVMNRIESRPSRRKNWEYVFFFDVEGHANETPVSDALAELEELQAVSATQAGTMRIEGIERPIAAIDPATIESVYSLGAETALADLGSGLFVLDKQLEEQGWSVGDLVAVEFALTGPGSMEIEGSFTDDSFAGFLITTDTYRENFGSPFDSATRIRYIVRLSPLDSTVPSLTGPAGNVFSYTGA